MGPEKSPLRLWHYLSPEARVQAWPPGVLDTPNPTTQDPAGPLGSGQHGQDACGREAELQGRASTPPAGLPLRPFLPHWALHPSDPLGAAATLTGPGPGLRQVSTAVPSMLSSPSPVEQGGRGPCALGPGLGQGRPGGSQSPCRGEGGELGTQPGRAAPGRGLCCSMKASGEGPTWAPVAVQTQRCHAGHEAPLFL